MKDYVIIISILVVVISSLITLNISFQQTLQLEMAEQFNKQQLLLAAAKAANIQDYIRIITDELKHIIYVITHLQTRDRESFVRNVREFFRGKDIPPEAVALIGRSGEVLFVEGKLPKDVPLPSFLKDPRGRCSQDLIVKQDEKKVYLLHPICRGGTFDGAVILLASVEEIARNYLGTVTSGLRGYAWMMDNNGDLLYHPTQPDMVGKNLYKADETCFGCHKSFDMEKKILEGKGSYYGQQVAPSGEDKVLAFSPVTVGDKKWIVAISAPYSEITMSIQRSMKFHTWLIVTIFVMTTIIAAMMIFFHRKKVKAEEIAKHQKELEHYAIELEQKVVLRTSELIAEKEKLNSIVSAIGSGIILFDNTGKIQWVNHKMREIAGKDIVGMNCDTICADCSIVSSYTLAGLQTEIMVNLFGRKDTYYQVTTAPIKGDEGEVHGYIRLVQDITEIKKMEEQMMHSEKLASIGRLTAGIAHEIGNPLTSVFSFVQILKEMESDAFKKESLETIYFHISRIADILKQLSGFSKTAAVELKTWKINSLIESSLSLIQYDKRAKDITITRDFNPDIPEIRTDGNQLSQVFVNLILNAVDAMPEGGTLTIRTGLKDGVIAIDFEDTGIGIPKEHLVRIFDPFFTTKEKGTGLGLAVSYNIIKKLNGELTVDSEESRGTRFRLTLPVNGMQ